MVFSHVWVRTSCLCQPSVELSTTNQKRQAWRTEPSYNLQAENRFGPNPVFTSFYWNAHCFFPPFKSTLIRIKINHLNNEKKPGGKKEKQTTAWNSCSDPSVCTAFFRATTSILYVIASQVSSLLVESLALIGTKCGQTPPSFTERGCFSDNADDLFSQPISKKEIWSYLLTTISNLLNNSKMRCHDLFFGNQ